MIRSLKHANFRYFFFGQGISLMGSWIQMIALGWLSYRLTNSPFLLGVVGFTSQLPVLLISPFSGVFADKFNKYKLMLLVNLLFMIEAGLLAYFTLNGSINIQMIIILSLFSGTILAVEMPTRQSFVVELVDDKKNLDNAIALNSFIYNLSRLIGPAIAGILISRYGEGFCFLINTISYFAVFISFLFISVKHSPKNNKNSIMKDFYDGINYIKRESHILNILIFLSFLSIMGISYKTIMPVYVKTILLSGPAVLGYLMSFMGIGAIIGALIVASINQAKSHIKNILLSSFLMGAVLIAFSFTTKLYMAYFLMVLFGLGMIVMVVSVNTLLQSLTTDEKRGRVMSFYVTALVGVMPIGSILSGTIMDLYGVTNTFIICGSSCIIATIIYKWKLSKNQIT